MKKIFPAVHAVMTRRILVNYRARPDVVARLLPPPFRPKLVNGWAMAGICLIRLEEMRPAWLPRAFGVASENAAHRIAVEWTEDGRTREGVFIPRRDTNSLLNHWAGGRLFPGVHHRARFRCAESDVRFEIDLRSRDDETRVTVKARLANGWPNGSVFKSLEEASAFFRTGACGWSPSQNCALEGVELHTENWVMHPLDVEQVESSFFSNVNAFPTGSIHFDCALLMRGIAHEWRALQNFEPRTTTFCSVRNIEPCCARRQSFVPYGTSNRAACDDSLLFRTEHQIVPREPQLPDRFRFLKCHENKTSCHRRRQRVFGTTAKPSLP